MFNVIEALWVYSSNKRVIDDAFIQSVIDMHLIDLDGYVKHHKYETIEGKIYPMEYCYANKTIFIDKKVLFKIFCDVTKYYRQFGFDEIYLYLVYNVLVFKILIHELDHAYQYKKVLTDNKSLESKLLGLIFYPEIRLARHNLVNYISILITKDEFLKIFDIFNDINDKLGRAILCERLAEIDSTKTIIGVLEAIDSCYINVKRLIDKYKEELFNHYKLGYSDDQMIVEPTIRYINEVKMLNVKELNKYIDKKVDGHYGEAKNPEERFRLGLYVSNQEINDIKRNILRK